MPHTRHRGPPMTLANMRAQGVRSLWVVCELCRHEAVLNVDRFVDAVPVPAFGPRMVVHPLWDHWGIRAAELAGAADGGEFDRAPVDLSGPEAHLSPGARRPRRGGVRRVRFRSGPSELQAGSILPCSQS
jgi:hypothetical protein